MINNVPYDKSELQSARSEKSRTETYPSEISTKSFSRSARESH